MTEQKARQVLALESKVTRMNREISDLYHELQRCRAEQKRLEEEAANAHERRSAAEALLADKAREFARLQLPNEAQ